MILVCDSTDEKFFFNQKEFLPSGKTKCESGFYLEFNCEHKISNSCSEVL